MYFSSLKSYSYNYVVYLSLNSHPPQEYMNHMNAYVPFLAVKHWKMTHVCRALLCIQPWLSLYSKLKFPDWLLIFSNLPSWPVCLDWITHPSSHRSRLSYPPPTIILTLSPISSTLFLSHQNPSTLISPFLVSSPSPVLTLLPSQSLPFLLFLPPWSHIIGSFPSSLFPPTLLTSL